MCGRAYAGRYHSEKFGTKPEHFAKIAWKNHKHSVNNPYAQFQKEYTLDEILASKPIYAPLTMLQCSPTSDGAGAAILASEEFVKRNGLEGKVHCIAAVSCAHSCASLLFETQRCRFVVMWAVVDVVMLLRRQWRSWRRRWRRTPSHPSRTRCSVWART